MTVREQFEEWARTSHAKPFDLRQFSNGKYRNSTVQYCWEAWNAALEQHG